MTAAHKRPTLLVGACVLSSAVSCALSWPAGLCPRDLLGAWQTRPAEQSLPLVLSLAVLAVSIWLAVVMCLGLAARRPDSVGAASAGLLAHLAPTAVRRALGVTLGVTTALSVTAGSAQAATPAPVAVHLVLDRPAAVPSLDRPAVAPSRDPSRGVGLVTSAPTRTLVTVHSGDSLWRIAARTLPRDSSAAAIERAWHAWYRTNRSVIGADPDLLQPGQQLTPPRPQESS